MVLTLSSSYRDQKSESCTPCTYKLKLKKVRNEMQPKNVSSQVLGEWFAKLDADCTAHVLAHGQQGKLSPIAKKIMAFDKLKSAIDARQQHPNKCPKSTYP